MSARTATMRVLALTTAATALGLALAQGAQAASPAAPATGPGNNRTAAAAASEDNPFAAIDLQHLKAEQRIMWPAGHPVPFWALVLDDETVSKRYADGEFFVYAPATHEFGWFLDTDIATRAVRNPHQVVIADSDFLRSHPRVEVRYGNPDRPQRARVVATATTWMR
ncbi:hypothetical protein [Streptomyces aureoversilis]|uniref:Secreted protein n=1 Tax=Streptomyces aureoversilis TaxID=67277 RepID=A0ABV9ZQE1_9ACTN